MNVSFFLYGPHEPPLVCHTMDAVPRVGEKVKLRPHYSENSKTYVVEDVEWIPMAASVNVDIRELTSFG